MCTAITLQSAQGENFFGRTMDFSYPIAPEFFILPKNYEWESLSTGKTYQNRYRLMGIGQETEGMLGFFDGINENGFAAAVLYFEGYADYNLPIKGKEPIASLDFLHYMLGRCRTVDDLRTLLEDIQIVGVADPVTERAAPLHWIATDPSGKSVAIEQTKNGLEIINNPIGVLSNSPDFRWHFTNLRNYIDISTTQPEKAQWGSVSLAPFSQGAGTLHLPGGFTSPERFVRAAFLKTHTTLPRTRTETMMACFHVINNVSIPKGIVITARGADDYTKYTAFMNTNTCEYYFKTYENSQIFTVKLSNYDEKETSPIRLGSIVLPLAI